MEEKRGSNRSKRQKPPDDYCWDCSVCTFKNSPEAYKCEMCDTRKGTSTRKPRLNSTLVAQQVAQQYVPPLPKKEKLAPGELSNPGSDLNEFDDDHRIPNGFQGLFNHTNSNDGLPDVTFEEKPHDEITSELGTPVPPPLKASKPPVKQEKKSSSSKKSQNSNRPPRLKNVDRSSAQRMDVTVNNITVTITDYQPKKEKKSPSTEANSSVAVHSGSESSNHINTSPITSKDTSREEGKANHVK